MQFKRKLYYPSNNVLMEDGFGENISETLRTFVWREMVNEIKNIIFCRSAIYHEYHIIIYFSVTTYQDIF